MKKYFAKVNKNDLMWIERPLFADVWVDDDPGDPEVGPQPNFRLVFKEITHEEVNDVETVYVEVETEKDVEDIEEKGYGVWIHEY